MPQFPPICTAFDELGPVLVREGATGVERDAPAVEVEARALAELGCSPEEADGCVLELLANVEGEADAVPWRPSPQALIEKAAVSIVEMMSGVNHGGSWSDASVIEPLTQAEASRLRGRGTACSRGVVSGVARRDLSTCHSSWAPTKGHGGNGFQRW